MPVKRQVRTFTRPTMAVTIWGVKHRALCFIFEESSQGRLEFKASCDGLPCFCLLCQRACSPFPGQRNTCCG